MKKQNAINKLAFTKAAVTELSIGKLQTINGGTGNGIYADYDDNTNIVGGCVPNTLDISRYIRL